MQAPESDNSKSRVSLGTTKSSSNNNEEQRDPITHLGGVGCILVALIVLKIFTYLIGADVSPQDEPTNQSYFRLHEAFQEPFQKMLSQGTYLVFVIAVCDILNIQTFHSSSLEQMIEVALVFFVLWVLVGIFLIFYAQSRMRSWFQMEVYAHDKMQLDKLQKQYAKIFSKQKSVGQLQSNKLGNIRETVEYLVLRLIFINPVALPSMSESYLRKDFNFALYLGFCYGKVLSRFFQLSLFSLVLLFLQIVTLSIAVDETPSSSLVLYLTFSALFVVLITLILVRSCLVSAERKLTPSVFDEAGELRDPDNFNLQFNEKLGPVDPFFMYD